MDSLLFRIFTGTMLRYATCYQPYFFLYQATWSKVWCCTSCVSGMWSFPDWRLGENWCTGIPVLWETLVEGCPNHQSESQKPGHSAYNCSKNFHFIHSTVEPLHRGKKLLLPMLFPIHLFHFFFLAFFFSWLNLSQWQEVSAVVWKSKGYHFIDLTLTLMKLYPLEKLTLLNLLTCWSRLVNS